MLVFGLLLSFSSYAAPKDDGIGDLKLGCKDPGAFHNQNPPSDIKITCLDERIEWVPTDDDDAEFKNHRTVCSRAVTNKPNLKAPKVCEPCGWPGTGYTCGGFKEVEKEVEMEFSVTCDEILEMETIGKFCQLKMLNEVTANETILAVKATGRTKKVCGVQDFMNEKPITPISQK